MPIIPIHELDPSVAGLNPQAIAWQPSQGRFVPFAAPMLVDGDLSGPCSARQLERPQAELGHLDLHPTCFGLDVNGAPDKSTGLLPVDGKAATIRTPKHRERFRARMNTKAAPGKSAQSFSGFHVSNLGRSSIYTDVFASLDDDNVFTTVWRAAVFGNNGRLF